MTWGELKAWAKAHEVRSSERIVLSNDPEGNVFYDTFEPILATGDHGDELWFRPLKERR